MTNNAIVQTPTPESTFDTTKIDNLLSERYTLTTELSKWDTQRSAYEAELKTLQSDQVDDPMKSAKRCKKLREDSVLLEFAAKGQRRKVDDLDIRIREQISASDDDFYERQRAHSDLKDADHKRLLDPETPEFDAVRKLILSLNWFEPHRAISSTMDDISSVFTLEQTHDDLEIAARQLGVYRPVVERPQSVEQAIQLVGAKP